ncbi:MAG: hypothetical protein H8E46_12330 [FCB group bacterium]|nr:hypothetical protein [FCB group bacterium]
MADLIKIIYTAVIQHWLLILIIFIPVCGYLGFRLIRKSARFHQAVENALKAMHK